MSDHLEEAEKNAKKLNCGEGASSSESATGVEVDGKEKGTGVETEKEECGEKDIGKGEKEECGEKAKELSPQEILSAMSGNALKRFRKTVIELAKRVRESRYLIKTHSLFARICCFAVFFFFSSSFLPAVSFFLSPFPSFLSPFFPLFCARIISSMIGLSLTSNTHSFINVHNECVFTLQRRYLLFSVSREFCYTNASNLWKMVDLISVLTSRYGRMRIFIYSYYRIRTYYDNKINSKYDSNNSNDYQNGKEKVWYVLMTNP